MMQLENNKFPLLPLRDIVVFPHMVVPLYVGREMSIVALEEAVNSEKPLILCAQKDHSTENPDRDTVYDVGVVANVIQFLKLPEGTIKVMVEAYSRVQITEWVAEKNFIEVKVVPYADIFDKPAKLKVYLKTARESFKKYASVKKTISTELVTQVTNEEDPSRFADLVAGALNSEVSIKQTLLENQNITNRLKNILEILEAEISLLDFELDIKTRVKSRMEKTHREYFLNEQMRAIQKELGEQEETSEIADLEKRISETKFSDEARTKALGELKKIKASNSNGPEVQVSRNYLEWLLELPWGVRKKIQSNIPKAEKVLDEDHFGLEKVKERIIEFIAVQKRKGNVGGSILCLVGPPGVGKTSLGQSVARATGREFVRISLGGLNDEGEIRGHRRTYIGSMPGRIIKSFRKRKSVNPLILLDEIDKMGAGRGDPASAMLEVLDPEQNSKFHDNYLDVDYDLSEVMFITTANYLHHIPEPLRDRMEIIQLDGYTEDEKLQIAKRHLIPELKETQGIKRGEFKISDRVVEEIIRKYTREAGVRNLKREIEKVMRKSLTKIVRGDIKSVSVNLKNIESFLGLEKFRYGLAEERDSIGVATGLAWTQSGGDLLLIESTVVPGSGKMNATGTLGKVMKESITAATSYVQSIAHQIGVEPSKFEKIDIHIHVPEGATPKEGPSAGVGMVTSIVSVLAGIPIRRDVAMTGEVTLRGRVLPIGGLKAKLLAAVRGGIKTVIIPAGNKKDLYEISADIKAPLEIIPVSNVFEVLKIALTEKPRPLDKIKIESSESSHQATIN